MTHLIVAGLGNRTHGDDGVGVRLVEALGAQLPVGVEGVVWESADAFTLAQALIERDRPVLFVDCARMGETPGTARWWPEGRARLINWREERSTHGFGLDYAIELARALGFARPLYVFGVEPADSGPGTALSPVLQAAWATLERDLLAAIGAVSAELSDDR